MFVTILVGLIVLLFFLYKYFDGNQNYWKLQNNIPSVSFTNLVGLIPAYTLKVPFHEQDIKIYNKFKEIGAKQLGGIVHFRHPMLYVLDPEIVKLVLVKDFDHFINRRLFESNDVDFQRILFTMKNQEWKDLRAIMSPTFTTGKIRRMFEIIDATGIKMVNYLKTQISQNQANDCIEIRGISGKFTLDVIAGTAFGIDPKTFENENSPFVLYGKKLQDLFTFSLLIKIFLSISLPFTTKVMDIRFFNEESLEFLKSILRQNIAQRRDKGEWRNDFIQLLLEAQKENKVELTDEVLISQCISFFFAGFDTTETLLMFASYELALNPDVQERLYEELRTIFEEKGGFNYESVMELEYLDMVISETLRKHAPIIRLDRVCNKDYPVPGTSWTIKKGTHVLIPTYAMQYDPEYYPEPQKFIPERFNTENKAKRHPYTYSPFGLGPRTCIAMRLALLEGKVAISHLVYNFKLSPGSKTEIPIKYTTKGFLKPANGLWLKVESRNLT